MESAPPPPPEPAPAEATSRTAAPRFDPPNIHWYFGAVAATIAAVAVISDTGTQHRGLWIFLIALAFFGGAVGLSAFARRFSCWVPSGVMATAAVVLFTTVAVGFEHLIGVWPTSPINPFRDFCGVPFSLALVTIAAGLIGFWLVRFGFVLLPVAVATVLALQWILPVFVNHPSANTNADALLVTGAAFVVIGMLLDARVQRSPAFWWHVLGLLAITVGLLYYVGRSLVDRILPVGPQHSSTWAWVTMLVLGAVLVIASFAIRRATWAAFGVAWLYAPALHFVDDWTGSWRFPLLMVFVGVALVFAGAILDVVGAAWPKRVARPILRGPQ